MTLAIPDYKGRRILVAGDVMLDRYWFGPTLRISPEAPVPVVRVETSEERPGGAANVAVNLASLGVSTTLLGATGADEPGERLTALLVERGVACRFTNAPDLRTITKLRVLSRNQQLLRLDVEAPPRAEAGAGVRDLYAAALPGHDIVVLSDYAKGALEHAPTLIAEARGAGIAVLVDPKGTAFERYRGATALTPNLGEFEAVVGHCADDATLVERGAALRDALDLEFLLVTRSERGMTLIPRGGAALHLPAEAREVYDVTGAGDTVIAVLAAGLAAGAPAAEAAAVANLAAGLVVRKLGVAHVTRAELQRALHQRGIGGRGVLTREQARDLVREARANGERVVMTNGCFDILHAGHVAYLEEAKQLGDRLLVAVNDDASVRGLKGDGRPVNPLQDRMAVLTGLAAVDWVVPFGEDTPADLIADLLPDVLVKGGDYRAEEIAGAPAVLANGGDVRVLTFRQGRSTSAIIDAIRRR
jgi:D-beta-D-heptose 7-phosphate kinase / D-beta-D-heptose 1-phosphate adenosyltransferase